MSEPKINLRYIRRVLQFIERGPKLRFDMRTYGDHSGYTEKKLLKDNGYPECGTRACFAGWGVLLKHKQKDWAKIVQQQDSEITKRKARKLFGFNWHEAVDVFEGDHLFISGFRGQFTGLKKAINRVLEERGMKGRV